MKLPGSVRRNRPQASGSIEEDYFQAAKRTYDRQGFPDLADNQKTDILNNLKRFFRSVKFVQNASELPVANDLGAETPWIPSQCQIQQMAFFDDLSTTVYVLKPLWDKMNSLSKAALVKHELAYEHQRGLGAKDSFMARRYVAHTFAIHGPEAILEGATPNSRRYIMQDQGRFSSLVVTHGNSMGKPKVMIHFDFLNAYPMLAKTSAVIDSPVWELESKEPTETEPFGTCIVKTPGIDHVATSAINGTTTSGLSLKLDYKTGLPIKLTILDSEGRVMTSGNLTGSNNCSGSPLK
ncbi:MAG: hypothetical protein JNM39_06600 [Bdellovibrionaceae bacterium]|nr:hypothetical protein [Pseudobdellovibrionaceae bacterium]